MSDLFQKGPEPLSKRDIKLLIYSLLIFMSIWLVIRFFTQPVEPEPAIVSPEKRPQNYLSLQAGNVVKRQFVSEQHVSLYEESIRVQDMKHNSFRVSGTGEYLSSLGDKEEFSWYVELFAVYNCEHYGQEKCWKINHGPMITKKE